MGRRLFLLVLQSQRANAWWQCGHGLNSYLPKKKLYDAIDWQGSHREDTLPMVQQSDSLIPSVQRKEKDLISEAVGWQSERLSWQNFQGGICQLSATKQHATKSCMMQIRCGWISAVMILSQSGIHCLRPSQLGIVWDSSSNFDDSLDCQPTPQNNQLFEIIMSAGNKECLRNCFWASEKFTTWWLTAWFVFLVFPSILVCEFDWHATKRHHMIWVTSDCATQVIDPNIACKPQRETRDTGRQPIKMKRDSQKDSIGDARPRSWLLVTLSQVAWSVSRICSPTVVVSEKKWYQLQNICDLNSSFFRSLAMK